MCGAGPGTGGYFGSGRDNITHFSGTRGKGKSWQCVGSGQTVDEIGLYSGFSERQKTAIVLFTITINRELLFKTNTMLMMSTAYAVMLMQYVLNMIK